MVARLLDREVLADARAEARDQALHLIVREHLVEACLLDVEDLAADRQDRLVERVAPLDRRAAGRVTLDDEHLGDRRILALAVAQLARQPTRFEKALASRGLARLAGRHPRRRGGDGLADDRLALSRVHLQPVVELVAHRGLDEALDLGVAELRLRLALELWFGKLDADDGRQPLADVVTGEVVVLLLEQLLAAREVVDELRHRRAETLFVRAALVRVDRVGVRVDGLAVRRRPLHRDLDREVALGVLVLEGDDVLVDDLGALGGVEVLDVVEQTVRVAVRDAPALLRPRGGLVSLCGVGTLGRSFLCSTLVDGIGTLVGEGDRQALVEEGHLLEARTDRLEVVDGRLEDLRARPERDRRASLVALLFLTQLAERHTARELHSVDVALLPHLGLEARRQGVDDRAADAVQTTGDLVAAATELASGVQLGEDELDGRHVVRLVAARRDAAAVVGDADAVVGQDRHVDARRVTGEGLVDRVVDDLPHEVMQAALTRGADVHAGPLADGLEALEDLDGVGVVLRVDLGPDVLLDLL